MNTSIEKKTGLVILVFALLMVGTVILHPVGGNVEHIIKTSGMTVTIHAIALLALPIGWIGFWGLTRKLGTDHFSALLGLAMFSFALLAVMMAAATNGIILPIFLHRYEEATPELLTTLQPIVRYSFAVNHGFDYIYTVAICLAMVCWSVAILRTRKMAAWVGWLGIVIVAVIAALLLAGLAVNSLQGLRIFVMTIIDWICLMGIKLYRG